MEVSYLFLYEFDNPIPQIKVKLPTVWGGGLGRLGTMGVFHSLKMQHVFFIEVIWIKLE